MIARSLRARDDACGNEIRIAKKDVIKAGGGKKFVRRQCDSLRERHVLPAPRKAVREEPAHCRFLRETRIIWRSVEVTAYDPGDRPEFSVGGIHGGDMSPELPNGLLSDGSVFADFTAIAF